MEFLQTCGFFAMINRYFTLVEAESVQIKVIRAAFSALSKKYHPTLLEAFNGGLCEELKVKFGV